VVVAVVDDEPDVADPVVVTADVAEPVEPDAPDAPDVA